MVEYQPKGKAASDIAAFIKELKRAMLPIHHS
jgi:hypothetical protein